MFLYVNDFYILKFYIPYYELNTVVHLQGDFWCIGWQNSGTQSRDNKNMTLLGGILFKSFSLPIVICR